MPINHEAVIFSASEHLKKNKQKLVNYSHTLTKFLYRFEEIRDCIMRKTKQKSLNEKLLYMEGFVYVKENQKFVFFSHLDFFFPPPLQKKKKKKKKVFVIKYTHKTHSGEFIYYMKSFKMILSWGHVTGNKAGESVLFCRDRSLRKKKERELRQWGHLWSEPQWNRRKHYQPYILKKWFQSRKFYCVFYMSVVTSLIFMARTLCHY